MIPAVLVTAVAAGILWADTGGRLSQALVWGWLSFVPWLIGRLIRSARRSAVHDPLHVRLHDPLYEGRRKAHRLGVAGLVCAAGLGFLSGFDRLDRERSQAERDALRAESQSAEAVRLLEAHVRSRRSGRWGEEVVLDSVHAADVGPALPDAVLLHFRKDGDGGDDPHAEPRGIDREVAASRADRLLWPGSWVRVALRIAPDRSPRNPGNPDQAHRLARRGQAAHGRLVTPDWVISLEHRSGSWRRLRDRIEEARSRWRKAVGVRLRDQDSASGLVLALAIGDRSGVSGSLREAFRRLGLSHLLAISGLHVGFVAGLVAWLFLHAQAWVARVGSIALPFDWASCLACAAASLYAWTSGAGVSVERAMLLFVLCALCRLGLRIVTPAAALAWVAVALLWMDPAVLFDAGAQLSFAACAALILGGYWRIPSAREPPDGRAASFGGTAASAVRGMAGASLVISLATAPLLVYHGLPLSTFSPIFNVLAIPWTGFVVLPTSLFLVLAAEWLPGAIVSVCMLPARALEGAVVGVASRLPDPSERMLLTLPGLIVLAGLGLFWLRRGEWTKATGVWIGISLAGASPNLIGPSTPRVPQVVFFDVGQGDASLVQGGSRTVLIDAGSGPADGSGGESLARGLRALGVARIDVFAVTHGDLDHRAGAARVLGAFPVEELWLPISGVGDAPLVALSELAQTRGTRVRWLAAGVRERARGDVDIDVLWPPESFADGTRARNDTSLVLRVEVDEMVVLYVADVGADVERRLVEEAGPVSANVLKVGHHGSRRSSSAAFLEAVGPSIAVVSAPCDAARGLPSTPALQRLEGSGASLWWTGRDGAVIVSREEEGRISAMGWGARRSCHAR